MAVPEGVAEVVGVGVGVSVGVDGPFLEWAGVAVYPSFQIHMCGLWCGFCCGFWCDVGMDVGVGMGAGVSVGSCHV